MAENPDCPRTIDPHQLVREGTSQDQRQLAALKTSYFRVDEHQPAHWMVFAQRYVEYLNYFETDNTLSGDWKSFFNQDVSAILSVAATQKVDFFKGKVAGYFSALLNPDALSLPPIELEGFLKKDFGDAFNALGTLAWQLEQFKESLPKEIALKGILQNSIQSELAVAFERLISYFLAASELPESVVDVGGNDPDWEVMGARIGQFPNLYTNGFSVDWYKHSASASWNDFLAAIVPDNRVLGGGLLDSLKDKLNYAAGYNLFTGIFDLFIKTYARTVNEAQKSLEKTFTEKDDHTPHYTLFLTFLRLLEFARDHANTLTARHLDYYYKEVLQLKEKPAEPNHAHVLLQLAKHKLSHQLKAGAEFNAGKDSKGSNVVYQLAEEIVANTAKVSELKSVNFVSSKLYAFPVVNSDDGRVAELTSNLKQWHPFIGAKSPENLAQVGFAVASHYLLLGEGHRIVQLNLDIEEPFSQKELCSAFDFYLTGAKGWFRAGLGLSLQDMTITPANALIIPLLIEGNQPAVVPLKSDIHGNGLPEGLPTLKAILKQTDSGPDAFSELQKIRVNKGRCSIHVCVGYKKLGDNGPDPSGTGLRKISLTNKFGDIKPDKPFQPFGTLPETGDYLIIGSDEVFQKKTAQIQFNLVWKGLPGWRGDIDFDWVNEFAPTVSITALKDSVWVAVLPDLNDVDIFNGVSPNVAFPSNKITLPDGTSTEIHFDERAYTLERRNGFAKITLLSDFGHKLYQATLSRYMLRLAKGENTKVDRGVLRDKVYQKDASGRYIPINKYTFKEDFVENFSQAFPNEPYTPEIESFTLSYTATVKLTEEDAAFHWLYPFGYISSDIKRQNHKLLPEFDSEAEFYIGLDALKPPQNAALLFQVVEGSADPTVKKPENHIQWSYLRNNEWVEFKATELNDETGQLTRSGIIRFTVPKDASNNDTLFLTGGKHWLRATVNSLPHAVAKIITVESQAALVIFKDQDNADDFLNTQLPAGSISKLLAPDAAIKKIEQPYPSFGGRSQENPDQFHTRASERLRHKNRAITLWDYEHLILEAFPNIYKVKCLNHMHLEPVDNNKRIHNELAPGHVTIVTLPKLNHLNAIDPLRPYTSLGELDLIKQFLEKHVSCFVKLHVNNPIFEEVRVDFKVKFFPGKDVNFHSQLIVQELIRFLSPWAFSDNKELQFGGKIYKSSLINFVEEREYVDYVTDFQLFQPQPSPSDNDVYIDGPDLEEAVASTAISILVSAAAEKHTVRVIPESVSTTQDQLCQC